MKMIIHGDCLEIMNTYPDNHFNAIVTDPPYFLTNNCGFGFMGKSWDSIQNLSKYLWMNKEFVSFAINCLLSMQTESNMDEEKIVQKNVITNLGKQKYQEDARSATPHLKSCHVQKKDSVLLLVITKEEVWELLKELSPNHTTLIEMLGNGVKKNAKFVIPISYLINEINFAAQKNVITLPKVECSEVREIHLTSMDLQRIKNAIGAMIGMRSEKSSIKEMAGNANIAESIANENKYNVITLSHIEREELMRWITSLLCAINAIRSSNTLPNYLIKNFYKTIFAESLRICKPGSFLLAFGGTRTYHLLTCAIEDAGWEIRDCIMWVYGSGFTKSHNHFGLEGYGTALKPAYEPIIIAMKPCDGTFANNVEKWGQGGINIDGCRILNLTSQLLLDKISEKEVLWEQEKYLCNSCVNLVVNKTKQEILEIVEFFAIKNAEQISIENVKKFLIDLNIWDIGCSDIHCQEELKKEVKENSSLSMLKYGKNTMDQNQKDLLSIILTTIPLTTELKICSLCKEEIIHAITCENIIALKKETLNTLKERVKKGKSSRWPANIIFDEEAGKMLDEMSGQSKSSDYTNHETNISGEVYGWKISQKHIRSGGHNDSGGASRFFYCAKASTSERNEGLEEFIDKPSYMVENGSKTSGRDGKRYDRHTVHKNNHPCVKPLRLMEYLIKLVMPPSNGLLLDPFAGSGTTILAAQNLGYEAIGIEKEKEYCDIAIRRTERKPKITQLDFID